MKPLPLGRIDIMELFRSKNPRLARRVPGFLLQALRAVMHEATLKRELPKIIGASGCEYVDALLARLEITMEVTGLENLPESPRIVVCANHPTGGIDGLLLMSLLCKR